MNAIVEHKATTPAEVVENVLIKGDLSKLSAQERSTYYMRVCESIGLNPLTKPFEYITLNGKLRLYALKDATDQLRSVHKVSVTDMTEAEREGVYIVKSKVQNADGRTDMAIGAVNIAGLKGEALANAMMKAETKSKRRATLSICGLGMLDETEVEDIPAAPKRPIVPSPSARVADAQKPDRLAPFTNEKFPAWSERYIASIQTAKTEAELDDWASLKKAPAISQSIDNAMLAQRAKIAPVKAVPPAPKSDPITTGPQPKSKSDGPDIDKDYDAWFSYHLDKINHADDGGWLESHFNNEIQPHEKTVFPSDWTDLVDGYTKQQAKLNSDE